MPQEKILIVDDDPQLRRLLGDRLQANDYLPLFAENGRAGVQQARRENPALVLLDVQMPEMDGMEALRHLREEHSDLPVVILTAFGTLPRAVEAMKQGAFDFLPKPVEPDHLLLVIQKALERKRLLAENIYFKSEQTERYRVIFGEGSKLQQILAMAQRVAQTEAAVLIEGESGTGKQVLAHFIHAHSRRRERPFIQVNCTTLAEQLFESDLFGHEKGAFTGAHQAKRGRVELAHGGTLFLDEIGELAPALQAKFLRFIEQAEFERVGGMQALRVDARLLAATNKNLEKEAQEKRFRSDLYYRLNVVKLEIPPLRERREDIPVLTHHFFERHCRLMSKRITRISDEAMAVMQRYHWPGNVRELENALERAVVLAAGDEITPELLPSSLTAMPPEEIAAGMPLNEALLKFKKQFVAKTLALAGGNQSKAAVLLNIQRTYLNRLMKELGLPARLSA